MATTEFGLALRRWRDQVTPEAAGLPVGSHRRATGLRREELAQLAGISVDYIMRLEQGRAVNPSEHIIEALARALRLSRAERARLFNLAGRVPPGVGTMPVYIPPGVQRMLDRLRDTPVAVFDAAFTQLTASPLYVALMGANDDNERNALRRNFLGCRGRIRHTPESLLALQTAQVAALRATAQRYPADQTVRRLIDELRAGSDLFANLWETGAVTEHQLASRKTIDHPEIGAITLDCDVLAVPDADLTVMLYTAEPGSEDAERLALLAVIGTQPLVG